MNEKNKCVSLHGHYDQELLSFITTCYRFCDKFINQFFTKILFLYCDRKYAILFIITIYLPQIPIWRYVVQIRIYLFIPHGKARKHPRNEILLVKILPFVIQRIQNHSH